MAPMEEIAAVETNMTPSTTEVSPTCRGNPYGIFDEPMRGAALVADAVADKSSGAGGSRRRGLALRAIAAAVEYSHLSACSRDSGAPWGDALGHLKEEDMR